MFQQNPQHMCAFN